MRSKLEVKLRSELHDAGSLLLSRGPEIRVRLGDDLRFRILVEDQVQVAVAAGERV